MKNESTNAAGFDAALAHGLARVALGLNIAMHGYTRLPNLPGFANGMVKQFAGTFLPGQLVYVTRFGIAIGEGAIRTLLFFGLLCRPGSCDWYVVNAAIDFRQHGPSAVGNSFGPNNICCVLLRIACNSSLRSFFPWTGYVSANRRVHSINRFALRRNRSLTGKIYAVSCRFDGIPRSRLSLCDSFVTTFCPLLWHIWPPQKDLYIGEPMLFLQKHESL